MPIILIALVYLAVFAITWYAPTWMSVLITIANFFMPDIVPFIDEAVMLSMVVVKLLKAYKARKDAEKPSPLFK
jgi:hypothetical protein